MSLKDAPRVVRDVWHAILEDEWMNIVVWGKPRTGKTTVQMVVANLVLAHELVF
jgi:replication-associated recombination protein RarA